MIDGSKDDIIMWGNSSAHPMDNVDEFDSHDEITEDIIAWNDDATSEENVEIEPVEMIENVEDKFDLTIDVDSDDSEESVYEKKYYKIREVESIIGETQSTIRFWEDSFAELGKNFCSQRSRGGTRMYTKENIENLKLLKLLLRERRLTIEGAIFEIKKEKRRNAKERALILLQETKDELNNLIDAYNCILYKQLD